MAFRVLFCGLGAVYVHQDQLHHSFGGNGQIALFDKRLAVHLFMTTGVPSEISPWAILLRRSEYRDQMGALPVRHKFLQALIPA